MSKRQLQQSSKKRNDYEQKPITRFKRLVSSYDPKRIEKRKSYAQDPLVKARRKELNKQRRSLARVLIFMLKNNYLKIQIPEDPNFEQITPVDFVANRIASKSKHLFADMTNDSTLVWHEYKDEFELNDKTQIIYPPSESDIEFKKLLDRFLEGDQAIFDMIQNSKKPTPPVELDLNAARDLIKAKLYFQPKQGGEIKTPSQSDSDDDS
jgi:hypothetical protein